MTMYLNDVCECGGTGWLMAGEPEDCPLCGTYATFRQLAYLNRCGYVTYLNLATSRYEIHKRIGNGTEPVGESFPSVLAAIAETILGVDIPEPPPAEERARVGDSETASKTPPATGVNRPGRPDKGAPSSTPPASFDLATALAGTLPEEAE